MSVLSWLSFRGGAGGERALHGIFEREARSERAAARLQQPDVGFEQAGQVHGRPVDALPGPDGAVYVSDDYAGAIYRVTWDAARAAPGPVFVPPRGEPAGKPVVVDHAPALERLAPAERADATLAAGAALFDRHGCAACHGVAGGGKPLAGLAGRIADVRDFL